MQDFDNAVIPVNQPGTELAAPGVTPDDEPLTIETTYRVIGEQNHIEDHSDEDLVRARQQADEARRLVLRNEEEEDRANRSQKNAPSSDPELIERTMLGKWAKRMAGITDHDSYLRVGGGKNNELTLKQAKEALLTGVLEKGWDTVYCYKGNKIDPQARSMMLAAVQELTQPDQPLHGRQIQVPEQRMRTLEPWLAGHKREAAKGPDGEALPGESQYAASRNPLAAINRFSRDFANARDDHVNALRAGVKNAVSDMAMNLKFKPPGGGGGTDLG